MQQIIKELRIGKGGSYTLFKVINYDIYQRESQIHPAGYVLFEKSKRVAGV
jgi:hypothetical protein